MALPVCEVLLTEKALVLPAESSPAETGAMVDFWGVVRETENGAAIEGIDYEAHRAMAEHQLRGVAEKAVREFELRRIMVHHRIGFVPAGEPSLLVRVESRHRAAAFRASEWVVNELKKCAPIWKHPRFKAGQPQSPPAAASASRA